MVALVAALATFFGLTVAARADGPCAAGWTQTETFICTLHMTYDGTVVQSATVPAGVTSLEATIDAAGGGAGGGSAIGGAGASAYGTVAVTQASRSRESPGSRAPPEQSVEPVAGRTAGAAGRTPAAAAAARSCTATIRC